MYLRKRNIYRNRLDEVGRWTHSLTKPRLAILKLITLYGVNFGKQNNI